MAKIVKTTTGEANFTITETFIDEEAATKDQEPESKEVVVTDYKIDNTKWRKEFDE